MKPLLALAVAFFAALLISSCGQHKAIPDHTFEMRSQCSVLADAFENRTRGSDRSIGAALAPPLKDVNDDLSFVNHYDAASDHCYVEIVGMDKESVSLREVFDAQERRMIVRCTLYKGWSGLKTTCDNEGGGISRQEATRIANTLMAEASSAP